MFFATLMKTLAHILYLKWIKTNMIKGKIAGRSKEELCFIIGDNILFHQGV